MMMSSCTEQDRTQAPIFLSVCPTPSSRVCICDWLIKVCIFPFFLMRMSSCATTNKQARIINYYATLPYLAHWPERMASPQTTVE